MDISLVKKFSETLIKRTLEHKLTWLKLTVKEHKDSESNYNLYMKLFECEFHEIVHNESHMLYTPHGGLYLVYERFESGKDGSTSEGYNLYFQKDSLNEVHKIDVDVNDLYRLKNAINSYYVAKEKDVVNFMEAFLANE